VSRPDDVCGPASEGERKVGSVDWTGSFEWRGVTGSVQVECVANDDPLAFGTVAVDANGFPVCTATVQFPRRGYDAMFGWVQLVRSTDNESAALLGFQWGFDIRPDAPERVELRAVAPAAADTWQVVLPVLRTEYPSPLWTFADSF
jgi:hypothetical protein